MQKKELKPLSETLDWKKAFWITGYVKTFSTSAIVSGAIASLIEAISLDYPELYALSIFLLIVAAVQLFIIDCYGSKKKKEELDAIDERINYIKSNMDNNIAEMYEERCDRFLREMEDNK